MYAPPLSSTRIGNRPGFARTARSSSLTSAPLRFSDPPPPSLPRISAGEIAASGILGGFAYRFSLSLRILTAFSAAFDRQP